MITRYGVQLPEASDLPALPRGVVWHWTAGGPRANTTDLAAYHLVVESDATVRQGKHPVAANMRKLSTTDAHAAHTGGWNSYRVGLAAAGMRGYRSPSAPGDAPLTEVQVRRMCELAAHFLALADLDPMDPAHACTHREVWTIHGIRGDRNHQKLDIEHLPFRPNLSREQVGPYLRMLTAKIMLGRRIPAPSGEIARPHPVAPALPHPYRIVVERIEAERAARGFSAEQIRPGLETAAAVLELLGIAGVPAAAGLAEGMEEWLLRPRR